MKKDIVILVCVAVGSMAAGFALVVLLLGSGASGPLPDPFADGSAVDVPASAGSRALASVDGTPIPYPTIRPPSKETAATAKGGFDQAAEDSPQVQPAVTSPVPGQPPAQVHPQPAPAPATGKLALAAAEPFVWRCWPEGAQEPLEKDACGILPGIEKMLAQNMGLVEQCVLEHAGSEASGKLSLALKVDFGSGKVNAWLGNSTTVAEVDDTSACIRSKFETLAPPAIEHEHTRYIVFFTISVN